MHSTRTVLNVTESPDTGPARDLVLDLVRAAALAVVVVWHWVFSTVAFPDGPIVGNPVGVTPGLWALTWILQPMPLFFAVGGCLHARSYDGNALTFWKRRIHRLLVPALPLLLPALAAIGIANAVGRPDVVRTLILLISPLWFLAVYLVLVLLAPLAINAHRRAPVFAFAALTGAAVTIDVCRFVLGWTGPGILVASFVAMWALVHQFGFVLDDIRRAPMITRVAVAIAGLGGLAAIVALGPYPAAMVGVPGAPVSNMGPPNLAPVLLGLFQVGMLATLSAPLHRFATRRRDALATISTWTMPVYVWHLLGWAIFYGALRAAHLGVLSEPTGAWWVQRPIWLFGPLLVTVPLCWFVGRSRSGGATPALKLGGGNAT
jgi:peptidoglycan/LPS O-acetylase OafA/YrhL